MLLICIDAHSKYSFVVIRSICQNTSKNAIDSPQQIFLLERLPGKIVTDNGSQFVSEEYNAFCDELIIKHLTTSTYHPASYDEAERFVQTFKGGVEKNFHSGLSLVNAIRNVLFTYCCAPHHYLVSALQQRCYIGVSQSAYCSCVYHLKLLSKNLMS